jgi:L-lactate dehydrogenase complex protein LldG
MPNQERRAMSARDQILANIRTSLGVTGQEAPRRKAVEDRLASRPKGVIPQRGQGDAAHRIAMFKEMVKLAAGTVEEIALAEVPTAVANYLRSRNLPQAIARGADARFEDMAWGTQPNLTVKIGPSDGRDLAALSCALGGVAETGTLVLTSGPDNPTTLNFLPDHHLVVVEASKIVGDYEAMWANLRAAFGEGQMPRTVNWITGPSRSADIEQMLILGAHGPRSLHVMIVPAQ